MVLSNNNHLKLYVLIFSIFLISELNSFSNTGQISGRVFDKNSGNGIEQITIAFYNSNTALIKDFTWTQSDGTYVIDIEEGNYKIFANNDNTFYIPKYYNNKIDPVDADIINVQSGKNITGIDFALKTGGRINGFVKRQKDDNPLEYIRINAYSVNDSLQYAGYHRSQKNGFFSICVPEGSYILYADTKYMAETSYYHQFYDHVYIVDFAKHTNIAKEQTIEDINFDLAVPGRIKGIVTFQTDNMPLYDIIIQAYDYDTELLVYYTYTNENGEYELLLQPSNYLIYAKENTSSPTPNYLFQYFNNVYLSSMAAPINLPEANTINNIDFNLPDYGIISGHVKDALYDKIPGNVLIEFFDYYTKKKVLHTWSVLDETSIGFYESFLPPGIYVAGVKADSINYINEYYDNTFQFESAHPIEILAGYINPNIDFYLTYNYEKGDVNQDKIINLKDAVNCLKLISKTQQYTQIYLSADVNNDDKIGLKELIYIFKIIADF